MKQIGRKTDYILIFAIVVAFMVIIIFNFRLISNVMNDQAVAVGKTRLESIRNAFETDISESESALIKVAGGAEQLLGEDGSMKRLEDYIVEQKALQLNVSEGTNFNVYIAGQGWEIIPDFDKPDDYHATERSWYVGAVENGGEIYITEPYIDSMTGEMCYTMSVMLSDNETVVAMDFNLQKIQKSIEEMSGNEGNTALIVTEKGTIVGYSDMSLVGKKLSDSLTEYNGILPDIISGRYGEEAFERTIDGSKCMVFHAVLKNDWYMLVSIDKNEFYGETNLRVIINLVVSMLMLVLMVMFYVVGARNRVRAENALRSREQFVNKLSEGIREPLKRILKLSDVERFAAREEPLEDISEIKASGLQLKEMLQNLDMYSDIVTDASKEEKSEEKYELSRSIRILRNVIVIILFLLSGVSLFLFGGMTFSLVDNIMSYQLVTFDDQLNQWISEQRQVLDMFADFISANEEILDDYDKAVQWMDDIAKNHSDISVCYIANPYKDPSIIMNNGWQPEEGWKVEDREWYRDTEKSENGFSISSPYYDEQTGIYCITMSKIVYGKNGEFLGIFAIDFYLDKLINIFGESYENEYYVFITDSNGDILNHPNEDYVMTPVSSVNIKDTPYAEGYFDDDREGLDYSYSFKDYNGRHSVAKYAKNSSSGFMVIMVYDWFKMYSLFLVYFSIYSIIFIVFIVLLIVLVNRVIKWQAEMNERLAQSAREATAAGKAKTDFLAQMSHEIRTPINAVIGMDEMILRETDSPEIREYADNIKSASNTLLTLINGILDFSKLESGRMEIISVKYEVVGMIDDLANMISEKASAKDLELKLDIDPRIPKVLYGDDVRIKQVITNILTNAVKYTQKGSVTLKLLLEAEDKDECTLKVSVPDTGIGIKQEDMEKLFQSFQRLDEKKNRNIEGTGLGMSIVQGLLSKMDSELSVESEYGKGSVFSFSLVQKIIDKTEIGEYVRGRDAHRAGGDRGGSRTLKVENAAILVVDDNDMNLKVAKGLMKRWSVIPDLVSSGQQCIDRVKEKHYDIIFMDHMMPVMDGIETLQELTKQKLISDGTPVIALTANAIVGVREMYLEKGFTDYLSKPIESELLEQMLIKYLPDDSYSIVDTAEADKTALKAEGGSEEPNASEELEDDRYFIDKLIEDGFNIEAATSYTLGDDEFYRELLETFVGDEAAKRETLTTSMESEDWKNYQIAAHALKSAARTIGADELSEMSLEHENASKNAADNPSDADFIKLNFENLMSKLTEVSTSIRKAL